MEMFPIHICKFFFRWCLYSNVCAVNRPDYIRKTVYRCKLRFNVWLVNCIVWEPYLVDMRMITTGLFLSDLSVPFGKSQLPGMFCQHL